jgi:multidrug efflux pump subunit AcrA (membrane-fusion protein)
MKIVQTVPEHPPQWNGEPVKQKIRKNCKSKKISRRSVMKFRKERSETGSCFKKRKAAGKKKIVIGTAVALTVSVATGGVYWKYQSGKRSSVPEKKVESTKVTAETGSISNTIVGTGNLEADTPVALKIPSGITVSEVKVESGDHVSSGDVLAEVDSSSVYEAMEEVQEKIKVLDQQIAELQEDTDDEIISASVDGRVKKIYISQGENITSCMLEHGALLVLSVDGKMAVDLTDPALVPSEEDTVTVTLSSGIQVEGTVEKVSDNECTITMTDSGVGLGDTATVTDEEGNSIGAGTTYIHQPLQVTGTAGSISEVNVSEDEAVDSGDTLLTLDEDSITAEYEVLYGKREALAETLTELLNLAKKEPLLQIWMVLSKRFMFLMRKLLIPHQYQPAAEFSCQICLIQKGLASRR